MSALTPEQIAKLRADGKTVREIAAEVGVSVTTIHRWKDPAFRARHDASARRSRLRHPERIKATRKRYLERIAPRCSRCGRPMARPTASRQPVVCGACYAKAVAERQERIRKLSLRGLGPTAIAERLGLPKQTVANDMGKLRAREELPPPRPHGFDAAADRELIALYENGRKLTEIAGRLGRDKRAITRRLAHLRDQGLVGRRSLPPDRRPPTTPPGFIARADIGRELGFESGAGLRAREYRIAAQDPELVARQRLRLTGDDGQLAVFYGPELAARIRAGGTRRPRRRRRIPPRKAA
jgi:transposase